LTAIILRRLTLCGRQT